ncbi:MAG: ABC1 kinase family protein [Halanaerobiales bacterium]
MNISKQYRHLLRYRKIAEVLLKNGLGVIVERLELNKYLPIKTRFKKEETQLNKKGLELRLRKVLQELGPTYIKLGQLLSTRADLLPPSYVRELRKLQDEVDPVTFEEIEEVLVDELGEDYLKNFRKIDKQPQAAASIAQTHRAILNDGTDVILKIQRPGIEKMVQSDFEILKNLILGAEERGYFPEFLKASSLIDEFRESLKKELNFKREVANINKFASNFKDDEKIVVPDVYEDLSSRRLIVMEEIKGIKLSDIDDVDELNIDGPTLAVMGAQAFMKQVLIDGFFHADPHPGNIFVKGKDTLAYIDFGLMGQLTENDKSKMNMLFIALLYQDINIITDLLLDIGEFDQKIDERKFKLEIQDLMNRYYGIELADIDFMMVIDDIERILYNFHVRMPEEFFLLFRAIGVNEGVGFLLDPSFNLVETARDFLKKLIASKLQPSYLLGKMADKLWNFRSLTKDLPAKFNRLLNDIINDEFTIRFKHINLEQITNKIDIVSNRISISLIISAIIIGSSMIIQTDMTPVVYGIPLLGFLGYSIAGIMGLWLVISIFRSGRF